MIQSINVDFQSSQTLATQIAVGLRRLILSGGLRTGERLPASRTLAADLGVSRTTILEVFERLSSEGLIESRIGAGTFVRQIQEIVKPSKTPFDETAPSKSSSNSESDELRPGHANSTNQLRRRYNGIQFGERPGHVVRAFTTALPALDMFPVAQWSRLMAKHSREQRNDILGYGNPLGYPPLRRAVGAMLRANLGNDFDDEQIFIVNGAQHAFQIIGSFLLERGDKVWFENPGAIGARNALLSAGADLVPLPIDQHGIVVKKGMEQAPDFRLAFVTPSHQQPLGITMSLDRRFELLQAAETAGAWIIEDDYDGQFHYGSHRLPALKSVDQTDRVLYVGTFSKTIFPALRLGYMLVPEGLVDMFRQVFTRVLPGAPSHSQAVLASFIDEGHFNTHLRRMRHTYAERHNVLQNCARHELSGMLDVEPAEAGLHTIGYLRDNLPEALVADKAEKHDIVVMPIRKFCIDPIQANGLAIGFSGVKPKEIEFGAKILARVIGEIAHAQ